jgi:hypothetical protein
MSVSDSIGGRSPDGVIQLLVDFPRELVKDAARQPQRTHRRFVDGAADCVLAAA